MGYANSDLVVAAAQPLSPPLPWQGKGGEAAVASPAFIVAVATMMAGPTLPPFGGKGR